MASSGFVQFRDAPFRDVVASRRGALVLHFCCAAWLCLLDPTPLYSAVDSALAGSLPSLPVALVLQLLAIFVCGVFVLVVLTVKVR